MKTQMTGGLDVDQRIRPALPPLRGGYFTMPGGTGRNGLPGTGADRTNYVYRGTGEDTLTAWMDDPRYRPLCGLPMARGGTCHRRAGHQDHCKGKQAMENDRISTNERWRQARERKATA